MSDPQEIITTCNNLVAELDKLKASFKEYLSDQSIPLDIRWDVFVKAPVELKIEDRWLVDFPMLDKVGIECDIQEWPYYFQGRGDILHSTDLVSALEEGPLGRGHEKVTPELIAEVKEHILAGAVHSFRFDW